MRRLLICCIVSLLFLQACSSQTEQSTQKSTETPNIIASTPEPATTLKKSPIPITVETPDLLSDVVSSQDLGVYLNEYENATMLLSDGVSQVIFNESLSTQRRSPYSTFKIPNSLIALEEGVVAIDNSIRKWDGTKYNRPELNQDQDLASGMKYSCVWYYQQLAREIGENAMQRHLNDITYGNMDISGGIDKFWLGSTLLISAQEQLDFIIRLYHNELPFLKDNMEYVKSTMHQEGYPIDIYGKTGSSGRGHGWFVGYLLINEKPYFFATYIEGEDISGLIVRDKTAEILNNIFNE